MREILFRGKRTTKNEFVYGSLYVCGRKDGKCEIANYNREVNIERFAYDVIPETVGQYTGLTDKNGNKIFEGDIVKEEDCVHNGEVQIYGRKWVVYFDKGFFFGWRKGYKSCGLSKFIPNISGIEIIGNIHDNPELLKEAEQE